MRPVLDHVGFEVTDLARSAAFYDALFHPLGGRRIFESPDAIGYGINDARLWIVARGRGPGPGFGHVAITAHGRPAVNAAYFEIVSLSELEDTLASLGVSLLAAALVTTLAGAGLGFWASRRALRPLTEVAQAAEAIAGGALDTRLESVDDVDLAPLARSFNDLSGEQRAVFIQLMTMSAADFLDQWFETDPLKATMSASGIIGTFQGIRSPGTAYVLLHHYMGEIDGVLRAWGIPRGGTGAVSESIASAARSFGAEIRTDAAVEQLMTRGDEVSGAVTSSGEEVTGRVTLSSLDPHQTFARLVPPGLLDTSFLEEVERTHRSMWDDFDAFCRSSGAPGLTWGAEGPDLIHE